MNQMKRSSRALKAALLTALVSGSMSLLGASSARAAVLSFGNFPGGVFGGEGCADVQGGSLANSTPVNAYNCTAAPNQQFEFSGSTIYALGGQRCLDVASPNDLPPNPGTPVDSYPCNGGFNQQWSYTFFGNGEGEGIISPIDNIALCLDATTGANGTQLVVNQCSFAPSQLWQIKGAVLSFGNFPGGVFGGENCADVRGGNLNAGTPVDAYNCTAAPNQQFEVSGSTIYALGGQTCLDVESPDSAPAPGTLVDSYPCNGGTNQQWRYGEFGDIQNVSGLCLDASSGWQGTQLVVNTCENVSDINPNPIPSQQWQIK
jgi:hypothetical protein